VPGSFDTLLIAQVLEHMDARTGEALLGGYLPFLRPGGRVVMICPQAKG
jgi:predicted SAM-dependent methyltransferase